MKENVLDPAGLARCGKEMLKWNAKTVNGMNKLEHGRWYMVSEAMPEDFEELYDERFGSSKVVLAAILGDVDCAMLSYRVYGDKWGWKSLSENYVSHWMAIPKIE